MAHVIFSVREYLTLFFSIVLAIQTTFSSGSTCDYKIGANSYKFVDRTWMANTRNNSYFINFCTLSSICQTSNICQQHISSKGKPSDYGKKPTDLSTAAKIAKDGTGFSVTFDSTEACGADKSLKRSSEVHFFCGKSLGTLEIIEENPCTLIFEFYTTQVCKNYKSIKEAACYIYNKNQLFDLSPLILTSGGHRVSSPSVADLSINICREISGSACPGGASACLGNKNIGNIVSFSELSVLDDGKLHLRYFNDVNQCSTNITFSCPKTEGMVGSDPRLESASGCHYEIVWETEFACPFHTTPSKTCSVATPTGLLDLSPLRKLTGFYKTAPFINPKDNKKYSYFLNVCGNIKSMACNPKSVAEKEDFGGCQTYGANEGKIIGDANHMTLRYRNGKAILIYRHGATCHTGYKRTTVITFTCDKRAGFGTPKYNTESYCNYYFDWATSLVCQSSKKSNGDCRIVTDSNVIYDLTELVRTGTDNWVSIAPELSGIGDIFLNVCGKLKNSSRTTGCPDGSSICFKRKDGKAISLGKFQSSPVLARDKSSITLTYSNGSPCATSNRTRTVIRFLCAPGHSANSPVLIRKTPDQCLFVFQWLTVYACPLGVHTGKDCKVTDPRSGFSFDLTPLKTPQIGQDYVVVKTKEYEYQLKVCVGSSKMSCNSSRPIGGCQFKPSSKDSKIMGYASSELMYYNGMLNLTYHGGEKCHDKKQTAREVHLTFFCSHSAGIGRPQYEKEVGCGQYNFIWYTKYACVPKVVQCVAYHPGSKQVIDLSGLASKTSWQTTSGTKMLYINVCRPLRVRPTSCSPFAAACSVEITADGKTKVNSLGEVGSPPAITSNGDAILTYTGGDSCDSNKNITTKIRFICREDARQGRPVFDASESNKCTYVFRWETSFICTSKSTGRVDKTCSVKDTGSDYVFNLAPLRKAAPFYRVINAKKQTFILNICGSVNGTECESLGEGQIVTSCLVDKKNKNPALGTLVSKLEYKSEQIVLTYLNGRRSPTGYDYRTVIMFICNRSIALGEPVFQSQVGSAFFFQFQTSLACRPKEVECQVTGADNKLYNLDPLEKEKGFWSAVNREIDGRSHHYILGVCRSIFNPPAPCRGGPYGACQIEHTKNGGKGHNMGYVQSRPSAGAKAITIRYFNGQTCHKVYNRSTRIFFHCSKIQGSPVFQLETSDCEYVFNWLTPSACPQEEVQGNDCKAVDSQYGHVYNLSALKKKDYTFNVGQFQFTLSVCKRISSGACASNAAACMKKGTTVINIGDYDTSPKFYNGDLILQYTAGSVKTLVKFICDKAAGIEGKGPILANDVNRLSTSLQMFEFEWRTALACRSNYEMECSVVNFNGKDHLQYDLSPLARWDNNWRALTNPEASGLSVKNKIFINVCRQLVKQKSVEGCGVNSGICIQREDGRYVNLGIMEKSPQVTGSSITLEYTDGDPCPSGGKYNAKIELKEDDNNDNIGEPRLIQVSSCSYSFIWRSTAARPVNGNPTSGDTNCRATNPLTGYVFDLNPLRGKDDYEVSNGNGGYFLLNVCGALTSQKAKDKCGSTSGACLLKKDDVSFKINGGNHNKRLFFDQILYLSYSDGDTCARCRNSKCNFKLRTVITFVCDSKETVGKPEFMSKSDDCTLFFIWRTKHACESQVQCTAFSETSEFTLSPLQKLKNNYEATVSSSVNNGGERYYINVCRNMHPVSGIKCAPEAAVCSVSPTSVLNLGQVVSSPEYQSDGTIVLKYDNGDQCEVDQQKKISSKIVFKCDIVKTGNPVLVKKENCLYTFEWATKFACTGKEKETQDIKNCKVTDAGITYDAGLLKRKQADYKVSSSNGISYLLNICAVTSVSSKNCAGAAVCQEVKTSNGFSFRNIGSLEYTSIEYENNLEQLIIKYGQEKDSTLAKSKIIMSCDPLIFPGEPLLETTANEKTAKEFSFVWSSAVACTPRRVGCTVDWNDASHQLNALTKQGGYSVEYDGFTYWINVCSGIENYSVDCPQTAAVCRRSVKGGETEILSSVYTQKITATKDYVSFTFAPGLRICAGVEVKTEIRIKCDLNSPSDPVVELFTQEDCNLVLSWHSQDVCFIRKSGQDENVGSTSTNSRGKSPGGIIAAVIICVIIAFLLGVIFRKKERRAKFVSSVRYGCKRYVCCRNPGTVSYGRVNSDESDEDEQLLDAIGGEEQATGDDEYHDDDESDEELLRL